MFRELTHRCRAVTTERAENLRFEVEKIVDALGHARIIQPTQSFNGRPNHLPPGVAGALAVTDGNARAATNSGSSSSSR